jgi:hypothetical protein
MDLDIISCHNLFHIELLCGKTLTLSSLQFNDKFSTQIAGGVLVYYVSAQPGKITAFKPVCLLFSVSAQVILLLT